MTEDRRSKERWLVAHNSGHYEARLSEISGDRPVSSPIRQSATLTSQVYEHVKAAIIAGDLKPDRLYSVNQLANALGVSRTPVREALVTLSREGLLQMDRNRGFRVVRITQKDLDEIIYIRELLEVPAMACLAKLRPAPVETFKKARQIYRELQRAADEGNALEFLALDRQFHLTLVAGLGNARLTRIIGELRDHMHLPGLRRLAQTGQLHESGREHLTLLEKLEAGDAEGAASVMSRHLARTWTDWS